MNEPHEPKAKLKWFNAGGGVRYLEHQSRMYRGHPDKSFYIRYKVNGKIIQERVGWASQGMNVTKAKAIRDEVRLAHLHGKPVVTLKQKRELAEKERQEKAEDADRQKKESLTFGDFFQKRYLPWAKEHKKSSIDDSHHFNKHLSRFSKKALGEISPFDVERLKTEMKKGTSKRGKPYSQATIKHQLVLLRRLYTLAKRWGLYDGPSPMDKVEVPKLDNQRTEFMQDDEVSRLLKVLETWPNRESAAFIKFALLTGMRRSELFKLQWGDVDFDRGLVTLRRPKGGKTQVLPVSKEALAVLEGIDRRSQYVFPGKSGGQRTDFKGPWKRIRQAAGLPENFRFHGLRHHFASALVSSGVDLFIVQKLLTHKSAAMTQRYAHLAPSALREAALNSGELLTKVKEEIIAENGGVAQNET